MKTKLFILMAVCLSCFGRASAQWVVTDPSNLAPRYHQYRQTDSTNVHYGKQCNEQFQGNAEDFPAGKRILRWCARIGDIINVALASY